MPMYFLHRDILPYAAHSFIQEASISTGQALGPQTKGWGKDAGEGEAMARAGLGRAPQGGPRAVQKQQGESHGDI